MSNSWQRLSGAASDVGIGADGSKYVIGYPNKVDGENYAVFRWTGSTWDIEGGISGVRIAVDPDGNPWVLKHGGGIYRKVNGSYQQVSGGASDVGIGADGSVYVIGYPNKVDGENYAVFRWTGSTWDIEGGISGVRIAVDPNGNPWVLKHGGGIYRKVGGSYQPLSGGASDVGIGADGSVFVIGYPNKVQGDNYAVFDWEGSNWGIVGGGFGVGISVTPQGKPWVVGAHGAIRRQLG